MIYGVYENKALVHWPPSKIFGDEIRVRQSIYLPPSSNALSLPDHRIILANLLFPPCCRLPRWRQDQREGNGASFSF